MTDPLLEVEDLTIRYRTEEGPLTAVSNATFSISRGQYFGLVGESGCGKSTIAKSLIGGLDDNGEVASGTIRYKGEEIQDYTEREFNRNIRWKEVSFIPQSSMNNLDPLKRVDEQAHEIARAHTDMSKRETLDRFERLFEAVGLQPERISEYPHQFSGGMQQRAIIALALLLEPSIVIADEPTTALDVIMQDQVFKELEEMKEDFETSMLLITHDMSVVFESCEKMAVMHGGQVAESGDVTSIYDEPRHPYSILLQRAFPDIENPERELETIDGTPPQLFGEVSKCSFADRCPWAIDECRETAPWLERIEGSEDETHKAACFRKDEVLEQYRQERGELGTRSATDGGDQL